MSSLPPQPEPSAVADRPICVFDSGLGGLTVVRELMASMPAENVVYLADTARVPYGIKSLETVRRFARQNASFLMGFDPKVMVVACNTASAAAFEDLQDRLPVPVVDVIRPGVRATLEAVDGPVGVIGTEATVDSGAYQRRIAQADPSRAVHARPCPLLVPIVEEGRRDDDPIVLNVLCDYLRDLQRARVEAIILGCTHYPLLAGPIGKLMGPEVRLINSGRAAALEVQALLCSNNQVRSTDHRGRLTCFTTDKPERFTNLAERFGGRKPDSVDFVGTDELEVRAVPDRQA
ncbi:MAG: glutamate racemase [Phycisphaerae bacterium]